VGKLFKTSLDYSGKICVLGLEAWGGMAQHPYTLFKAVELIPEEIEIYFIGLRQVKRKEFIGSFFIRLIK